MAARRRIGVVLFNLGGPDSLEAVEPFLRNLFSDPAILRVPRLVRPWLAGMIAHRRAPVTRAIYEQIGGRSPILEETRAQAEALAGELAGSEDETRVFIAMRYWHPRAAATAREVAMFAPDQVVLLPLYPQYSTTTTASSMKEFGAALQGAGYRGRVSRICCYPANEGLIAAHALALRPMLERAAEAGVPRLLFSAHGLPERIVRAGDPYPWQIEQTAKAIIGALGEPAPDWTICYQSRVGRLKWIGPAIGEALSAAIAAYRVPVVVPVSFVSEHSETLVELDIRYRELAAERGAKAYFRVPAVGVLSDFVASLAGLVREALACESKGPRYCNRRICPQAFFACPNGNTNPSGNAELTNAA
jgi:ferrochelatase